MPNYIFYKYGRIDVYTYCVLKYENWLDHTQNAAYKKGDKLMTMHPNRKWSWKGENDDLERIMRKLSR